MMRFEDEVLMDLQDVGAVADDALQVDYAIYPVVQTSQIGNRPVFRRLHQNIESNPELLRQYLFPRPGTNARGVWVDGLRGAAVELARRLGLHRITEGERHAHGVRHVHGYTGRRRGRHNDGRSEHIFYGRRVPRAGQNFFD